VDELNEVLRLEGAHERRVQLLTRVARDEARCLRQAPWATRTGRWRSVQRTDAATASSGAARTCRRSNAATNCGCWSARVHMKLTGMSCAMAPVHTYTRRRWCGSKHTQQTPNATYLGC
jgi:hypothetical protein